MLSSRVIRYRIELRRQETEEMDWVVKCFKCGKEGHKYRECPKCHDLAKQLSYYLYLLFFSFLLDLLHRKECGKVSHSHSHMMGHMISVGK